MVNSRHIFYFMDSSRQIKVIEEDIFGSRNKNDMLEKTISSLVMVYLRPRFPGAFVSKILCGSYLSMTTQY